MQFGLAASHDKHHSDPSWRHTWENFKEILTDFPEYLPNTYLQYYLYAKECAEDGDVNYTRANMVMDGREKEMYEQVRLVKETNSAHEVNLGLFNAATSSWMWRAPSPTTTRTAIWSSWKTTEPSRRFQRTPWWRFPVISVPGGRSL